MLDKLPHWFRAKYNKDSSTRKFLTAFKDEIDKLGSSIKAYYNNTSLDTFENIDYVLYKYVISSFKTITLRGEIVDVCDNEIDIIRAIENYESKAYFDKEHSILYISGIREYGATLVTIDNKKVDMIPHRVWNADIIDEFGLILDMPRLDYEDSKEYKDRLLSYSRMKANSSPHGMCSYIGHRTGRYAKIQWIDGGNNIKIPISHTIICTKVFVDDNPYPVDVFDNIIVLKGDKKFENTRRCITVFYGFDINSVMDVTMTDNLREEIMTGAPVSWGYARWNDITFVQKPKENEYLTVQTGFDPDLSFLNNERK